MSHPSVPVLLLLPKLSEAKSRMERGMRGMSNSRDAGEERLASNFRYCVSTTYCRFSNVAVLDKEQAQNCMREASFSRSKKVWR